MYIIVFLVGFFVQGSECVLHIPLCAGGDACRVQSMHVTFLNKRLWVGPDLVGRGFAVPIFKIAGVEPALEEKAYSIVE